MLKEFLQKLLPKKTQFAAIDIGTREIKLVEVKITGGRPQVCALGRYPTPPGAWTDEFDEEALVSALGQVALQASPGIKEVITCIGGEKVITRHIRLPVMPPKELEAAVKYEAEKFIPIPVNELIIRHVKLDEVATSEGRYSHLLLAAVPAALIYQYHGIFARAGLVVTAADLQPLALWRAFKSLLKGTCAIIDTGAATTHLTVVREGLIQFTRTLPVGGNVLTRAIVDSYALEFEEAQRMKEEEAELLIGMEETAQTGPGRMQMDYVLRDSLLEIVREIRRSLEFYAAQEQTSPVEKLILSGGTSKLKGLGHYLEEALGLPVEPGIPDLALPDDQLFDPVFSIAAGLVLREVVESV